MRVLQFTLPVEPDKSVIIHEEKIKYFYPHLHRHNETQLMWIIKGEGTLLAGTEMHPFKDNDIFLLGANQPHIFKNNPEYFVSKNKLSVHSINIYFNPAGNMAPMFSLPEMKALQTFIEQHASGFKIPAQHVEAASEYFIKLNQANSSDTLVYFLQLLKFLQSIQKNLAPLSTVGLNKVTESEGMRIGNIYDYILKNFDTDISLDNVAAVANMTPHAFCRYFKKRTRNTFIGFLNEIRINEACKKLIAIDFESVSTVAYNCGFNSITNFNRVFKTVKGVSPVQYITNYKSTL